MDSSANIVAQLRRCKCRLPFKTLQRLWMRLTQSMVNARNQNSLFDCLRNSFFYYFYHMKNFIIACLLALACVTGLSASAPPPDDGSDAVSYCVADDIAECALVPAPVFALPLPAAPLPYVSEVAILTPKAPQGGKSNKSNSATTANNTKRLQGVTGDFDYKATTIDFHSSCGGLSRLQGCKF